MILYKLVKNNNKKIPGTYGKYYARPAVTATISIDQLAEHMSSHNTPFSAGAVRGILTDMVKCVKELVLSGYSVKIDDLAIFSIGIRPKKGADTKESFTVAKNIEGVKLRARATGKLTNSRLDLDATLKDAADILVTSSTTKPGGTTGGGTTTPSGGSDSNPQVAQAATLPAARIPAAKESNVLTPLTPENSPRKKTLTIKKIKPL